MSPLGLPEHDIWIVPAAGSVPTDLTPGTLDNENESPDWSTDGSALAFIRRRSSERPDVGLRDEATAATRTWSRRPAATLRIRRGPDRSLIAYDNQTDIQVIHPQNVTDAATHPSGTAPSWRPRRRRPAVGHPLVTC